MSNLQAELQAAVGDAYRIEKELGGGGMSRVFVAEDVQLGRRVVIKVLPPEMCAGVNVERFRREIQLAAKLQHPHIVPLLAAGSRDDLLYYMMPLIEGESLRAKLAREGELPVGEAVKILKEVVDALAYAHRNQVVHRDIKPDNVLLSEGHAVVTDFGVAKAVTASTGESSLTSLGVALGTPAYMAPEQAVADPHVDHRADIYAAGAMAYEMLTGRPPFSGPNPQAVLSAHVTEAPEPATKHRTTVPESLNALLMRCLEKKAADRWQKAEELLPHLDAILTPSGGITPTGTQPVPAVDYETRARQAHPVRVASLFALASVVALAIVYVLMRRLGLPDWVFLGAIALLVIGLPIMLWTGHHERRRAIATMTGVHVATPSGLERHFTWRKALLGGGLAFSALAVTAASYMVMRTLGIGPVGTLVASGVLDEHGLLIVTEFDDRTPDGDIGASVTEALRIDLSQSPMVRLMDATSIKEALTRMNRADTSRLNAALAQEIARREQVKALVVGDVGTLGTGYVVSARLVGASDGAELLALRETADNASALIPAVDRLSAKLRERIGESLRTIRASEPLARVTTASIDALRLYTRGSRAQNEGDPQRAIALVEEAIAVDSSFAMAYRRLAVLLSNNNMARSRINAATTRAYELRERLPPVERYLATAYYFDQVEADPQRVVEAYESVLEFDPEDQAALNNLALVNLDLQNYARSEELYRRAIATNPIWQNYYGLTAVFAARGEWAKVDSVMVEFEAAMPDNPRTVLGQAYVLAAHREYDAAAAAANDAEDQLPRLARVLSFRLHEVRGQLGAAGRIARAAIAEAEREGDSVELMQWALVPARLELRYGGSPERAAQLLEQSLGQHPLESIQPEDRPYEELAELYLALDRPAEVRRLRVAWESAASRLVDERQVWDARVAMAERRYGDAIESYRASQSYRCNACDLYQLAQAFELAGETHSALTTYERAIEATNIARVNEDFDDLAPAYRRLGELYEERNNQEKAVQYYNRFVELWSDADPELQPLVEDVRNRIARLTGER